MTEEAREAAISTDALEEFRAWTIERQTAEGRPWWKILSSEEIYQRGRAAGVAEGIRQAREAVAGEEPMRIARETSGFRGGAVTPEFGVKLALAAIDALEVEG